MYLAVDKVICQGQMSNECIFQTHEKMFLFSHFIKQMLHTIMLVTNK